MAGVSVADSPLLSTKPGAATAQVSSIAPARALHVTARGCQNITGAVTCRSSPPPKKNQQGSSVKEIVVSRMQVKDRALRRRWRHRNFLVRR